MSFNFLSFNNISIKAKIISLASFLIVLMLGTTGYALITMNSIGKKMTTIAEQDMPLTKIITEITVHQLEQAINFERALRYGEKMKNNELSRANFNKALSTFNQLNKKVEQELKRGQIVARDAHKFSGSMKERNEFEHVSNLLLDIENQHTIYDNDVRQVFFELSKGNVHQVQELAEKVEKEEEIIDQNLEKLLLEIENFTELSTREAEHDEQRAFKILSIAVFVSIIVGVVSALVIAKVVSTGINAAVNVAKTVASGDLTQKINVYSTDEIGMLFLALEAMQDKLKNMILNIQQSAAELAASAEEMAVVTEQTNKNILQETSEIQQSATAIHEMTSVVGEVARNASSAADSAGNANDEALKGNQIVKQTIASIQQLAQTIENNNSAITQLGNDSNSIGSILDVIKSIAEQTNLLALNAAIEAARAGEQGRGFAVVADEVRSLAQRTQKSTLEIEEMIDKLQMGVKNTVQTMELGQKHAQNSVEQAAQAGATLEVITSAVSNINDMNTQIAAAAEQQTTVTEDINQNITELSQIAEQNSTSVNEMSSTSEEVARMATHLQNLTRQFSL